VLNVVKAGQAINVGARTLARAQRLVHQVVEVLAPGGVPRVLTDGLMDYRPALLTHIGHGLQAPRRSPAGGRYPTCAMPRWSSPINDDA
jgi:hypothetical protein